MKKTVSLITTFYKGHKYLPKLIAMFRANVKTLGDAADAEYIIINDSPWEQIDLSTVDCSGLCVRVIDNPENYGIHKSRVQGIRAAKGEYLLILDQDDELADNCLASQLAAIGDGDAVVSNGIKESDTASKKIYRDGLKMRLVNHKLFYLMAANQIVSPGQCLLRKAAIPAQWLDNPQAVNGADDLFLWLLMLNEGKRFVLNDQKLYIHKQVGSNLSNSLEAMCASDLEMCRLLRQKKLLPEKDIAKRMRMCAFLKHCGYRNRPNLSACFLYFDVIVIKIFAYFI